MRLEKEREELKERGIRAAKKHGNYQLVELLQGKGDCCSRHIFWPHEIVSTLAISKDYEKILPEVLGRAPINVETVNDIPDELKGTTKGLMYALSVRILGNKQKESNPYLDKGEEIAKFISTFPNKSQRAVVASYIVRSLQGKSDDISLENRMKRIGSNLTRNTLDNIKVEESDNTIGSKDEYKLRAFETVLDAASKETLAHLVEQGEIVGKPLGFWELHNLDHLLKYTDKHDLPIALSEMNELDKELGDEYRVSDLKGTFREVLRWRDTTLLKLATERLKKFSTEEGERGDYRTYGGLDDLTRKITDSKTLKNREDKLEALFATLSMAKAGEGRIGSDVYENLGKWLEYGNANEIFVPQVRAVKNIMEEVPRGVCQPYLRKPKRSNPSDFVKGIDQLQVKDVLETLNERGVPKWADITIGAAAMSGDVKATANVAEKVELLSRTAQRQRIYESICRESKKEVQDRSDRWSFGYRVVDTDQMLTKLNAATSETSMEVFKTFSHKRYKSIRDSYTSTIIYKPEFVESMGKTLLSHKKDLKKFDSKQLALFDKKIFQDSFLVEYALRNINESSELTDRVVNYVTAGPDTPSA